MPPRNDSSGAPAGKCACAPSPPGPAARGKSERAALRLEYENGVGVIAAKGRAGAARFAAGAGRHGAKI
jgi:hypothetical protein